MRQDCFIEPENFLARIETTQVTSNPEYTHCIPWWIYVVLVIILIVLVVVWILYRRWYWKNVFGIAMLSTLALQIPQIRIVYKKAFNLEFDPQNPPWLVTIGLGLFHFLCVYDRKIQVPFTGWRKSNNTQLPPIEPGTALNRLPSLQTEAFIGRGKELAILDKAWRNDNTNIISIVASWGFGKSALVSYWLSTFKDTRAKVVSWSFSNQGKKKAMTSAETFIEDCLRHLGYRDELPRALSERARLLVEKLQSHPVLLVLDGLEPLQACSKDSGYGKLRDPALSILLKSLAIRNLGLVVITSRFPVTELSVYQQTTCPVLKLHGLESCAATRLLQKLGVHGQSDELRLAAEEMGCHPLSLVLLGSSVRDFLNGDIRRRGEITTKLEDILVDDSPESRHTSKFLHEYIRRLHKRPELLILSYLSLFDRPIGQQLIDLLKHPTIKGLDSLAKLSKREWMECFRRLRNSGLLSRALESKPPLYDTHPIFRAFFAERFRKNFPDVWQSAHEQLYLYFLSTAKDYPKTRKELEPLYSATIHGCLAGKANEACDAVYRDRIHRGEEFFATRQLAAFGEDMTALSTFFTSLWDTPREDLTPSNRSFVLHMAGSRLRALGMLNLACDPLRLSLGMAVEKEEWRNAAIRGRHYSEVSLRIGNIAAAIELGRSAVTYADRSRDIKERIIERTVLANALHRSGIPGEARQLFEEAEALLREYDPDHPYLYPLWGYWFCDLMLEEKRYDEVLNRAEKLKNWAGKGLLMNFGLLDEVWGDLLIGRVNLLRGLLTAAAEPMDEAIRELKTAGYQDDLPIGLLARARLRILSGDHSGAQDDLKEVLVLAEFGDMRLYQSEAELLFAWLALKKGEKSQLLEHLNHAVALVNKTGYHLLNKELESLKKGI
ncbi:MAG: hypothetical protein JXA81_08285 [Sedimentisphaerales bacterium]|nr:hypothetical protein [Sedimentisphaerales bacterium]